MDSDCTMSSVEWHRLYNKERLRANAAEEKLKALEARTPAPTHCQCAECKPWLGEEKPAPATDVDALLAEADSMLSRMATRGDDKAFNVIQRLATALRESRAREERSTQAAINLSNEELSMQLAINHLDGQLKATEQQLAAARAELGALGPVEWETQTARGAWAPASPLDAEDANVRAIRVVKEAK